MPSRMTPLPVPGSRFVPFVRQHHDMVQTTAQDGRLVFVGRLSTALQREESELVPCGSPLRGQKNRRCFLQRPRSSAVPVWSPVSQRCCDLSWAHTLHNDISLRSSNSISSNSGPSSTIFSRRDQSSTASSPQRDSHDRPSQHPSFDRGPLHLLRLLSLPSPSQTT